MNKVSYVFFLWGPAPIDPWTGASNMPKLASYHHNTLQNGHYYSLILFLSPNHIKASAELSFVYSVYSAQLKTINSKEDVNV